MMRATILSLLLVAVPQSAWAQKEETFRISSGLYFECVIASKEQPGNPIEFDVSQFVYADRPSAPQTNFFDPSKTLFKQTGWMTKGQFVMSRLASDSRFFVWVGNSREQQLPQINQTIELTPIAAGSDRAAISVIHFVDSSYGQVFAQEFTGTCQNLTGKAAWDRFQTRRAK